MPGQVKKCWYLVDASDTLDSSLDVFEVMKESQSDESAAVTSIPSLVLHRSVNALHIYGTENAILDTFQRCKTMTVSSAGNLKFFAIKREEFVYLQILPRTFGDTLTGRQDQASISKSFIDSATSGILISDDGTKYAKCAVTFTKSSMSYGFLFWTLTREVFPILRKRYKSADPSYFPPRPIV